MTRRALRRLVPLAVFAATLQLTTAASGATRENPTKLRLLTIAHSSVKTDGLRYAAYLGRDDRTRVIDTRKRRTASYATPTCTYGPTVYPARLATVGSGYLLWEEGLCRSTTEDVHGTVLNLASGEIAQAPDANGYGGADNVRSLLRGVGRHWIDAQVGGHHWHADGRLNWRTGARIGEPGNASFVADLDDPSLRRRMCSPLRRLPDPRATSDPYDFGPRYLPFEYEPPYGVTHTWGQTYAQGDPVNAIRLYRCGHSGFRLLSGCRSRCSQARLAGGLVAWGEPGEADVHRLGSGTRYLWRVPDGPRTIVETSHTRTRLYVSVTEILPNGAGGDPRIYVARIPG